jgi:hydroxyacylglutathione hydrolase
MIKQDPCEIIAISLGMVNCFLLKGENGKAVLIDCGVIGSEKKILKAMEDHGTSPESLEAMIITHGHSDHMGACSAIKAITGAKTIIHKKDAKAITNGESLPLHALRPAGRILKRLIGTEIKGFSPYEPEILVEGEFPLYEYGVPGKIIETPGHTAGSITVLLEDGNAMAGDALSGSMFGKGKPQLPIFADDPEQLAKSIKELIRLEPGKIYTGHGGPFTLREITDRERALLPR